MTPKMLPCGYYLCRANRHWQVARWMPQANHWLMLGVNGRIVPHNYFDEIGQKVA